MKFVTLKYYAANVTFKLTTDGFSSAEQIPVAALCIGNHFADATRGALRSRRARGSW